MAGLLQHNNINPTSLFVNEASGIKEQFAKAKSDKNSLQLQKLKAFISGRSPVFHEQLQTSESNIYIYRAQSK